MELKEVWKNVLGEIELQISRPNFLTWLKNSELTNLDEKNGTAIISLPNNFAKEWVKTRYHKLILEILRQKNPTIKNIEYIISSSDLEKYKKHKIETHNKLKTISEIQPPLIENKIDPVTNLNYQYTFDNFVVGSSNELAYSAGLAIVKEIGKKYNPLFVYGGVGLGKTHLIQAIGNEIKKIYQNKIKVLYVPSEYFINEVVAALRNKRVEDIKSKYRNVDVLIIDDIQFIGGKPSTELEFFYTFNALHSTGKQIIISSDRPPAAIPTLEERLKSRFEGGIITDISYPDYEMRLAILKTKTKQHNVDINDQILDYIATKVQKNIRELEGVLNKVIFYQQYKNEKINLSKLEQIINETVRIAPKNITSNEIINAVAEVFSIPTQNLIDKNRKQEIVQPRQIAMYLMRELLKMSYPNIGEKFGNRDHTTVMHACEKISKEINFDAILNQKIITIKEIIFSKTTNRPHNK
ncbi:MAG: chromosomal replication initiator protein DnaA [Minisyncoccia bacterium]